MTQTSTCHGHICTLIKRKMSPHDACPSNGNTNVTVEPRDYDGEEGKDEKFPGHCVVVQGCPRGPYHSRKVLPFQNRYPEIQDGCTNDEATDNWLAGYVAATV